MALVHFDSHPDTWDQYFGSRYFHGTMFRRAVEEGLIDPRRTFQIAIRGPLYAADDFDFQAQHGMTVVRVEAIKERGVDWVVEQYQRLRGSKVYVSFDIDAVDPAYAPGTGTPEVGGLTAYEALALVRGLRGLDFAGFQAMADGVNREEPEHDARERGREHRQCTARRRLKARRRHRRDRRSVVPEPLRQLRQSRIAGARTS